MFPDSTKLRWRTHWILWRSGWTPMRSVSILDWTDTLQSNGWPVTAETECILRSVGGLDIKTGCCGCLFSTINMNPSLGCDYEEHAYVERTLVPFISDSVCVVGVYNNLGSILVGKKGIYLFMENCVSVIGHCWIEALEMLLLLGGKSAVWRSCIDERPSVILDGMPKSPEQPTP